ncbi:MAG: heme ABC transporter permease [Pseudomonadales bacterium]|nr:heme ABC transporter permease [Pseudomonadales bacterium]
MHWWNKLWQYVQRTVGPRHFYEISGRWQPWLGGSAFILLAVGLVWGLAFAPPDYQQGNSYRIIFIHVPAAAIAMGGYGLMAIASGIFLVWKVKTAEWVARSVAPLGAWFTLVSLLTGSLWGKPTWGTYWVWDARLTSMLILLFLYWGVMALYQAYENSPAGGRVAALLTLVGVVNLPIIHYSVAWWNTLHQASSFSLTRGPSMPPSMYLPLLVNLLGFYCLFGWMVIARAREEILLRESKSSWVRQVVTVEMDTYGV